MIDATRSKALLLAFLVLVAMLVAACGSSGSGPLTKAEFLKQGNEICAESASQRREDVKNFEGGGEGGAAGMEQLVATALNPLKNLTGELSSLEAPAAQMKAVKVYVAQLERGIAKVEAKPSEAISGSAFDGANAAAQRAGLPACTI